VTVVPQVMSKSCCCKFLHDLKTSTEDIIKLEQALETHTEFKTELCFRRKNGESYFKCYTKTLVDCDPI